jgi:hypothetical protein
MRNPQLASENASPTPACKPSATSQPTNFAPGSSGEGEYLLAATKVGAKATEGEITITDTLPAGFGVSCVEDQSARKGGGSMNIEAKGEAELELGAEVKLWAKLSSRLKAKFTFGVVFGVAVLYGLSPLVPNTQRDEMAHTSWSVDQGGPASGSSGEIKQRVSIDLGEEEISITSTAAPSLKMIQGITCSMRDPVKFCHLSFGFSNQLERADADREPGR